MESKTKINLSKKQLGIIVAVIILGIILIAGGVTCIVREETPIEVVNSVFTNNEEKIVGNWQVQDKKDLFAYEFKNDGTYKNYIAGFPFNGKYELKGNKLILTNPKTNKELVYKVKFNGNDDLSLTKKIEDGEEVTKEVIVYKRVEHINTKTFPELLNDLKNEQNTANN